MAENFVLALLILAMGGFFPALAWLAKRLTPTKPKLPIVYYNPTPERLAQLLRDAALAHHEYERVHGVDPDWQSWYARFITEALTPRSFLAKCQSCKLTPSTPKINPAIQLAQLENAHSIPDATGDDRMSYLSWNFRSSFDTLLATLPTMPQDESGQDRAFTLLQTVNFPIAACAITALHTFVTERYHYAIYTSWNEWPKRFQTRNPEDTIMAVTNPEAKAIAFRDSFRGVPITDGGKLYLWLHECSHLLLHRHATREYTMLDKILSMSGAPTDSEMRFEAEAELSVYFAFSALKLPTDIPLLYMTGKASWDPTQPTPFRDRLVRARSLSEPIARELVDVIKGCDHATSL